MDVLKRVRVVSLVVSSDRRRANAEARGVGLAGESIAREWGWQTLYLKLSASIESHPKRSVLHDRQLDDPEASAGSGQFWPSHPPHVPRIALTDLLCGIWTKGRHRRSRRGMRDHRLGPYSESRPCPWPHTS